MTPPPVRHKRNVGHDLSVTPGALQHVVTWNDGAITPHVHYLSLDGTQALCGHLPVHVEYAGATVQRLFQTTRTVNCKACHKSVEMALRVLINGMKAEHLEQIADLVFKLRSGNGGEK